MATGVLICRLRAAGATGCYFYPRRRDPTIMVNGFILVLIPPGWIRVEMYLMQHQCMYPAGIIKRNRTPVYVLFYCIYVEVLGIFVYILRGLWSKDIIIH